MVNTAEEASAALKAIDPDQRRSAAIFLADHPSPAVVEILLNALGDPDADAHEAMILALVRQATPELVARLVTLLREEDSARRNAALGTLIEIGARAPHILLAALKHPSPEVRLHVTEVLSNLQDPQTIASLLERLSDNAEFPNVRHAAAQALGKIGDRAATPALIQAAEQHDFWVSYAAVEALGRIGDERAVDALLRLMESDVWIRPAIVQALGNIGQVEAVEALATALEDTNETVRTASVEALVKIVMEPGASRHRNIDKLAEFSRVIPLAPLLHELHARVAPRSAYAAHLLGWLVQPEALPDLIALLGENDETLRYAAIEAILHYGQMAAPALLEALTQPQALIRENAAEMLGMLPDSGAVPALLERLADEDLAVRQAAVRSLGSLGGEAAYQGLLQALEDPATQDTAMGVLGQLHDANLISHLQRFLYEGKSAMRWTAAQALSLFGDEAAVSILLNAMRLPDEAIRRPAAEALARVRNQRGVTVLIEALGDRDGLVRQKAIEALGNISDSRAVAALLPLTRDPEWRVRQALVTALVHVGDMRVYEPLLELARDSDHWIRRAVMDLCMSLEDSRMARILMVGLEDEEPNIRQAALISLGRRRDFSTLEFVAKCLTDPHPGVRLAAVRAVTLIGGLVGIERMALLVHDPEEEIRLEVADALGEFNSDEAFSALEVLLQDQAPTVRTRAAEALAHVGTLRAAEALAASLSHPLAKAQAQMQLARLGDQAVRALLGTARAAQPELRAAAAETLGQLRNKQAVPTLKLLLRDTDLRVRQAAEAALKAIGS